jgi:hypothetical protein
MKFMIEAMSELAKRKQLYHNEYHFRAWLARIIDTMTPNSQMPILEFAGFYPKKRDKLDMIFELNGKRVAVETKYVKGRMGNGEPFEFEKDWYFAPKSGAANDITKYGLYRDIIRLESIVKHSNDTIGCCVLLTNSRPIWSPPTKTDDNDFQFRLDQDIKRGKHTWLRNPPRETLKEPIVLRHDYSIDWRFFSKLPGIKNAEFWYLSVVVR